MASNAARAAKTLLPWSRPAKVYLAGPGVQSLLVPVAIDRQSIARDGDSMFEILALDCFPYGFRQSVASHFESLDQLLLAEFGV